MRTKSTCTLDGKGGTSLCYFKILTNLTVRLNLSRCQIRWSCIFLLLLFFALVQAAGGTTEPRDRPSSNATSAFTHTQQQQAEEENLVPGVTGLQEERTRSSPVLRSTLEHIVQQLDVLTQVSSATF